MAGECSAGVSWKLSLLFTLWCSQSSLYSPGPCSQYVRKALHAELTGKPVTTSSWLRKGVSFAHPFLENSFKRQFVRDKQDSHFGMLHFCGCNVVKWKIHECGNDCSCFQPWTWVVWWVKQRSRFVCIAADVWDWCRAAWCPAWSAALLAQRSACCFLSHWIAPCKAHRRGTWPFSEEPACCQVTHKTRASAALVVEHQVMPVRKLEPGIALLLWILTVLLI